MQKQVNNDNPCVSVNHNICTWSVIVGKLTRTMQIMERAFDNLQRTAEDEKKKCAKYVSHLTLLFCLQFVLITLPILITI
jgi:hypothetical protein